MKSPLGAGMEVTASEMAAFLATGFFCRCTDCCHTRRPVASFGGIAWSLMQGGRHAAVHKTSSSWSACRQGARDITALDTQHESASFCGHTLRLAAKSSSLPSERS